MKSQKPNKKDPTRNQRQARRREHEKEWLEKHGWRSWEALHTALMNENVALIPASFKIQVTESRRKADL